jgi:hypothetical protein
MSRCTQFAANKQINYLINYSNLHVVQLKQTEVCLITMSYYSKSATGRLGPAPQAPGPLWSHIVRGLSLQDASNKLRV